MLQMKPHVKILIHQKLVTGCGAPCPWADNCSVPSWFILVLVFSLQANGGDTASYNHKGGAFSPSPTYPTLTLLLGHFGTFPERKVTKDITGRWLSETPGWWSHCAVYTLGLNEAV